jgi:hypothetical protein
MAAGKQSGDGIVKGAFGERNRARLIAEYFQERNHPRVPAWEHIYRLLLWVNQTTGLAHCYESDKCQPGKPWYGRSLAFHDWAARALGVEPIRVAENVDWLFRRATKDLAEEVLRTTHQRLERAELQRKPFADRAMPQPGEDPELVAIIREGLTDHLNSKVPRETWNVLVGRIREYLAQENKRKNLVGEGFEDVITAVIRREVRSADVHARALLHELPGFNRVRQGEKPNKVDVAILKSKPGRRTLVTAKWSIRADREKQFATDFGDYVSARADSEPFNYVLVTNEFDPARLMRACEKLGTNEYMFSHVVHINPEAIRATYGETTEESATRVLDLIAAERLIGFDRWLELLGGA